MIVAVAMPLVRVKCKEAGKTVITLPGLAERPPPPNSRNSTRQRNCLRVFGCPRARLNACRRRHFGRWPRPLPENKTARSKTPPQPSPHDFFLISWRLLRLRILTICWPCLFLHSVGDAAESRNQDGQVFRRAATSGPPRPTACRFGHVIFVRPNIAQSSVYRSSGAGILLISILYIGGFEHYRLHAPEVRRPVLALTPPTDRMSRLWR